MATFLCRPGRLAFRRRGYVALLWVAVLAAVGLGALQAPGAADEEFSTPGIESQRAFDLMQERFPGAAADGATARVVFVAPHGQRVTAAGHRKAIEETVTALGDGAQVAGVTDPFTADAVSKDGTTAYATVTYKVKSSQISDAARTALDATDTLLDGIRTVAAGEALLSPGATRALITRFLAGPASGTLLAPPERLDELTPREREVTALAARGKSNDEIAGELVLSVLTVRSHIQRALTKLGARDRAQLVVIAYQTGLVRPESRQARAP